MAKKRLNKKVAIIGTILLALIVLGAIFVLLRLTQGPDKFIKDGDIAYSAKDYERAAKNYNKALAYSKTNAVRKKVLFQLADTYQKQNDWPKVIGCWKRITIIDTADIPSRERLLDFSYEMADSGQSSVWKNVLTTIEELVKLKPGARYYRIQGRTILELAKRGEISDRQKALADATAALNKAKELDPKNPDVYWYLAQSAIFKGELLAEKGLASEKDKGYAQAQSLLKQACNQAPKDPNTYINLLGVKMGELVEKNKPTASLEDDYLALSKKFPASALVYSAISNYYKLDPNSLAKALSFAQKAWELDKNNIGFAINVAELSYYKGAIAQDSKLKKTAVEIAKFAATLPTAQLVQGPREWINKMNRLSLCTFMANCHVSELLDMPENTLEAQKAKVVAQAEEVVHEIKQIWGTGDQPYVIQIEGMLEYAKGNKDDGVRKMYSAYQQLKQADPDARHQDVQLGQLSYVLAQAFADSPEIGARQEFLYSALLRGIFRTRPSALLDYGIVTLQLRAYEGTINAVNMYEKMVKPDSMSRILRAKALIGAGQIDEADSAIAKLNTSDPNYIGAKFAVLQARIDHAVSSSIEKTGKEELATIQEEIKKFTNAQEQLAEKLIQIDPNASQVVAAVAERLMSQNRYDEARTFIARVLATRPDNSSAKIYKMLLDEKDPGKVSPERRLEISETIAKSNSNKLTRSLMLADIYRSQDKLDKAVDQYKEALELDPSNRNIMIMLFETALSAKETRAASNVASSAKKANIDKCEGLTFAARLSMHEKDYKTALEQLDEAIKICPLSYTAFLLRSNVNSALEQPEKALADAQKASSLNPLDNVAAKQVASLLYQRNIKLGRNVTEEQQTEARTALERAFALNPREWQLLSFYAEYISDKQPDRALSIRQRLQKVVPTVENATMLGNMAFRLSQQAKDTSVKNGYLQIAADAYQQGYKIDPSNSDLLFNFARFLRANDQPDKATQLVAGARDKSLQWRYYLSAGQIDKAKQMLGELYKSDSKNVVTLKGLLMVAQAVNDSEGIVKYSQELLAVENTVDNQIIQIKSYLDIGLISQGEKLLESFVDKNPTNTQGLILQTYLHTRKGELKEALDKANKSIASNANDFTCWHLRGQIYMALGKYDEAVADFQKAKAINPTTKIRMDLARAYLRNRRGDDAITELNVAIQEDENSQDARQMLEAVYMNLNRKEALTKFYADIIKKFPEHIFWYNQAGSFAIAQKNISTAISIYKSAWQTASKLASQNKTPAYIKQGQVALDGYLNSLLLNKQYSDVVSYSAQYIDTGYAPIAFARMADAKSKLGDKKSSLDLYRKALDKSESDEGLLLEILGRMSETVGRPETIAWCQEQLKSSPNSISLNLAMSNLMQLSTEYNKALAYINKCMEIVGAKGPAYRSLLDNKQTVLVKAYQKTSEKQYLKEAISLYEKLISEASLPEQGALNNLAYLLAVNDIELEKAAQYAKKAYDAAPTNPNIMDTYAYVLYKKGDYAKAAELIHMCIQIFEQSSVSAPAESYQHAGMINEKLGRKAQAIAAYKQAVEHSGNQPLSDKDKELVKAALQRLGK